MRIAAPSPTPDPAQFADFAASLRSWLVALLAWMVDVFDHIPKRGMVGAIFAHPLVAAAIATARRQVARDLRRTVAGLRLLLIAHAYCRVAPIVQRRAATNQRPRAAPPGFRLARPRAAALRQMIGDTLKDVHCGSLRQRAERLRDMLDNLEPLIAKVAARMARLLHRRAGPALVLIAAQETLRQLARYQPAFANTS
jgi:hypothetical protein